MEKTLNKAQWLDKMFPTDEPTDNYAKGLNWMKERGFEPVRSDLVHTGEDGVGVVKKEQVFHVGKVVFKGDGVTAKAVFWCRYKGKKWHVDMVVSTTDEKDGHYERRDESAVSSTVDNAIAKLRGTVDMFMEQAGKDAVRETSKFSALEDLA